MRAHYYDLNYPIFNVADSAISIGVVLIILVSFFGRDDDAERQAESFQLASNPDSSHLTPTPRRSSFEKSKVSIGAGALKRSRPARERIAMKAINTVTGTASPKSSAPP